MKRNKSNFFTILVRNYIIFTGVIVITIIGILWFMDYEVEKIINEPKVKELVDYASIISYNESGEINEERIHELIGKNSFIQILDKNNNVIYESNPGKAKNKFTDKELEYIPNYYDNSYVDVHSYVNDKKQKNICVSITDYDNEDNIQNKIYVVDENLNIIYTSTNDSKKSLTKTEFRYLTGTYPKGYDIRKYSFKNKNNEKLTFVIYTPSFTNEVYNKIQVVDRVGVMAFILIYILLIIVFVCWLNYKVKKPINILNEAIIKFKNGERENYVEYNGTQEFSDICRSFNDMSRKLYDSERKRESLEQEKQKILADISHDLKTPITVIKGYSKAVYDNLISEDEKDQYLMTIYKKADDLDKLINTFHEYSKLEHPNYKLVLKKVDICEYARIYLAEKYEELYLIGVEIEAEIPDHSIYCNIDEFQLKRVFENIISNSIKHNKKNLSILFAIKEDLNNIKINIADNGYGIPKEIHKDIFEPFVVGEKSRTNEGSGLGLAISKKIIQAHGGNIKIVDPKGKYKTEFEIILPIKS